MKNRETATLWAALCVMLAMAKSRGYEYAEFRADGEGGLSAVVDTVRAERIEMNIAGPGEHVPVAERMIRTIKGRVGLYNIFPQSRCILSFLSKSKAEMCMTTMRLA